jgi:hypothetical protein
MPTVSSRRRSRSSELVRERGGRRGRELQLGQARHRHPEADVGSRLAQVRDQAALVVGLELLRIETERLRKRDQHARGDRTLVRLDL